MLILVTLVVAARFWIRIKLVKGRAGADDWCILVAWILAAAFDFDLLNRKYGESTVLRASRLTIVPGIFDYRIKFSTRSLDWLS